MKQPTLCLYEHQTVRPGDWIDEVRVGEGLVRALQTVGAAGGERFLRTGHRSVTVRHYVGVISAGGYTLEILPKIDAGQPDAERAFTFLLDLLRACGLLPEVLPLPGGMTPRSGGLLELLVQAFCRELEQLTGRALRRYQAAPPRLESALRGRVHWPRQAVRHPGRPPGWVQVRGAYSLDNEINAYLGAARACAARLPLSPTLLNNLRALQTAWPESPNPPTRPPMLPPRWRAAYGRALLLAELLLQGKGAGLPAGDIPAPALLFDMNSLFEHYVCRQLEQHRPPDVELQLQASRPFWQKQYLRPDIVLQRGEERVVADVKWKLLPRRSPEADDLRQLYVYQRFFGAARGALLFPDPENLVGYGPYPYAAGMVEEPHPYESQLVFVKLVRNGRLNRELGRELYEMLLSRSEE